MSSPHYVPVVPCGFVPAFLCGCFSVLDFPFCILPVSSFGFLCLLYWSLTLTCLDTYYLLRVQSNTCETQICELCMELEKMSDVKRTTNHVSHNLNRPHISLAGKNPLPGFFLCVTVLLHFMLIKYHWVHQLGHLCLNLAPTLPGVIGTNVTFKKFWKWICINNWLLVLNDLINKFLRHCWMENIIYLVEITMGPGIYLESLFIAHWSIWLWPHLGWLSVPNTQKYL